PNLMTHGCLNHPSALAQQSALLSSPTDSKRRRRVVLSLRSQSAPPARYRNIGVATASGASTGRVEHVASPRGRRAPGELRSPAHVAVPEARAPKNSAVQEHASSLRGPVLQFRNALVDQQRALVR